MAVHTCPIRDHVETGPNALAIITPDVRLTYLEMDRLVSNMAVNLRRLGVCVGDKVGFVSVPTPETISLFFACFRIGAVAVPVSAKEPLQQIGSTLAGLNVGFLVHAGITPITPSTVVSFEAIAAPTRETESVAISDQHIAVLIRTSGTSGPARFVALSVSNLWASAWAVSNALELTNHHRWVLSVPMHHVSGLGIVIRVALSGATVVIPSHSSTLLETLYSESVTHLSGVPTQLQRLLADPVGCQILSGLTAVMLSGSDIHGPLIQRCLDAGVPIQTAYGLTEMASTVSLGKPTAKSGDSGVVLPNRSVRIEPDGEILVRGNTLCLGYYDPSETITLPLTETGWFRTGDLGVWDGDHLIVTGRKNDIIISGGENIHPVEIESHIHHVFSPRRVAVTGVSHPVYGQRPIVYMDPYIDIHTLHQGLAGRLPKFKFPDSVLPWPNELEALDKIGRSGLSRHLISPLPEH